MIPRARAPPQAHLLLQKQTRLVLFPLITFNMYSFRRHVSEHQLCLENISTFAFLFDRTLKLLIIVRVFVCLHTRTKVLDSKLAVSSPAISKPQPPPYGSHLTSTNSGSSLERRKDAPPPRPLPNPPGPAWPRTTPSTGSSSQQIQQRISVPPSPTFQPNSPLFPPGLSERLDAPPAVAVRPLIPDRGSRPQSPRKGPATMNSSSIYHMYLQQAAPKGQPLKPTLKAGKGRVLRDGPVLQCYC